MSKRKAAQGGGGKKLRDGHPELTALVPDVEKDPQRISMFFMGRKGDSTHMALLSNALSMHGNRDDQQSTLSVMMMERVLGRRVPRDVLEALHTGTLGERPDLVAHLSSLYEETRELEAQSVARVEGERTAEEAERAVGRGMARPLLPGNEYEDEVVTGTMAGLVEQAAYDLTADPETRARDEVARRLQTSVDASMRATYGDGRVANVRRLLEMLACLNTSTLGVMRALGWLPDNAGNVGTLSAEAVKSVVMMQRHMLATVEALGPVDGVFRPHVNEQRTHVSMVGALPDPPKLTMKHILLMCRPVERHPNPSPCMNSMCVSMGLQLGPASTLEVRHCNRPGRPGGYMTPEEVERGQPPSEGSFCIMCIMYAVYTAYTLWTTKDGAPPMCLNPFTVHVGDTGDTFDPGTLLPQFVPGANGQMRQRTGIYGAFPCWADLRWFPLEMTDGRGARYTSWAFSQQVGFR